MSIKNKLMERELINLRKEDLTYKEKATIVREFSKLKNINPKKLAVQYGLDTKEVYRWLQTEKFTPLINKRIKEGNITEVKAARIIYGIKDKSEENIDKTVEFAINNELGIKESEQLVAELNDPKKTGVHMVTLLNEMYNTLGRLDYMSLLVNRMKVITILRKIETRTQGYLKLLKAKK